ncbi:hypothetical protein EG329_011601 [Mollisiaceae sp. DMI_Dod_QoI]|nr:hypothetical protein EG329_011601 [Helotiales sp. DMI_Dod_QoI]
MKQCPVAGCNWEGAKRPSRVKDHLKKVHPEYRDVPLKVPEGDAWASGQPSSGAYAGGSDSGPSQYAGPSEEELHYQNSAAYPATYAAGNANTQHYGQNYNWRK